MDQHPKSFAFLKVSRNKDHFLGIVSTGRREHSRAEVGRAVFLIRDTQEMPASPLLPRCSVETVLDSVHITDDPSKTPS